jgi:hypothetical protein
LEAFDHAALVVGYNPGSDGEEAIEVIETIETRCRRRSKRDYSHENGCARRTEYLKESNNRFCCRDYTYEEEITVTVHSHPYFIVQNTWGTDWGEDGYARFAVEYQTEGACGFNILPHWVSGRSVAQTQEA